MGLSADDAVIYCKYYEQYFVKIRLENTLTKISNKCKLNSINMNVDKTKSCIYGTGKNVNSFTDNMIGRAGCQISQCHQYCYLSVTLAEALT